MFSLLAYIFLIKGLQGFEASNKTGVQAWALRQGERILGFLQASTLISAVGRGTLP